MLTMRKFVLRSGQSAGFTKTVHIAVDFGTTFSAAAYAIDHGTRNSFDTRDINVITQYPDSDGSDNDKNEVPTELLYQEGERYPSAWGWSARNSLGNDKEVRRLRPQLASRFKLLLSNKIATRDIRESLERRFTSAGRVPLDLIRDFLALFRAHILQHIQSREDDEAEFLSWRQKWTFTVPADWTPHARRKMLEAISAAGFDGDVKLVSEPEAAALYIMERRAEERKKLTVCLFTLAVMVADTSQLEDAIVVGDLGGGTIDAAAYLISGLSPLSVSGLAFVRGEMIGSSNLNDGFRAMMKRRLKPVSHQLEHDSSKALDQILDDLVDWFELNKRSFRGPNHRTMYVPISFLKEDTDRGFQAAQAEILSEELVTVFEPVIEAIIALLRDQVRATVHFRTKAISRSKFKIEKLFLTGGLSASQYVYERVKEEFENPRVVNQKIPVLRSAQPETAVVLGGVWRSLNPERIEKRVSETSYGFRRDETWTEGWPYGSPKHVENPLTGALEVKDRMKWVIKKGENFKNNHRVPYRLERYVPVGGSLEFEESLYYSDTVKEDHIHYEKPDIHLLGVLQFSLEKWRDRFNVNTNDRTGERYIMIEYDLVSTVSEDNWSYEIEVFGKKTCFGDSETITAGFKLSQGQGDGQT